MAQAWASPGGAADQDGLADDMRRWGADEEAIKARLAADDADATEVIPANAEAVRVFCAADTQWRLAPSGAPLGLDYQGVLAAMAMLGIAPSQDLHERLRVIEGEARDILTDRVAAEQKRAAQRARAGARRPPRRGRR